MIFFTQHEVDQWIEEDAPLLDLTSHLLGLDSQPARLTVTTRHPVRVTLTEEAARIFTTLGAEVTTVIPSGYDAATDECLLVVKGSAGTLHRGWKVAMNLLEHGCGVASRTAEMVALVRKVSAAPLLVTRKHPPGQKKILSKAILSGGAELHRAGLSETVLLFENHLNLIGGRRILPKALEALCSAACEKKITIECHDLAQAEQALSAGADAVQFDKVSADDLQEWCAALRHDYPRATLLVAGGLRMDNIQAYASCGVDGLVLSSVYHAPPADLAVEILPD
ncbi:MAG TPA: ModD protein [Guyparkeria sp.]|nr:ModD protein [Guyparkeria sp.]